MFGAVTHLLAFRFAQIRFVARQLLLVQTATAHLFGNSQTLNMHHMRRGIS